MPEALAGVRGFDGLVALATAAIQDEAASPTPSRPTSPTGDRWRIWSLRLPAASGAAGARSCPHREAFRPWHYLRHTH